MRHEYERDLRCAMVDINDYIKAWRERAKASREADKRRAREAHQVAQRCAEVLVDKFGARRVYLFGSLAEDLFRRSSDIDLVVEGLDPAIFFKAYAEIDRLAGKFNIDLIPFEAYEYKSEIFEKGKLLYESR